MTQHDSSLPVSDCEPAILTDKEMEARVGEKLGSKRTMILLDKTLYRRADGGGWEPYPEDD